MTNERNYRARVRLKVVLRKGELLRKGDVPKGDTPEGRCSRRVMLHKVDGLLSTRDLKNWPN